MCFDDFVPPPPPAHPPVLLLRELGLGGKGGARGGERGYDVGARPALRLELLDVAGGERLVGLVVPQRGVAAAVVAALWVVCVVRVPVGQRRAAGGRRAREGGNHEWEDDEGQRRKQQQR